MDAAWALYEAWVAIQTGEVDSALDLRLRQVVARRPARDHDAADRPVLRRCRCGRRWSTWPRCRRARYLDASGATEQDLAEVAARASAQRAGRTRTRSRAGDVDADDAARRSRSRTHPLRDADIAPITDGAAAIVIAAGDVAASGVRAARRGSAASTTASTRTRSACATSRRRESTRAAGERGRRVADGGVDVAELHAQFSHEELILAEALGLERRHARSTRRVGRSASNPVMAPG